MAALRLRRLASILRALCTVVPYHAGTVPRTHLRLQSTLLFSAWCTLASFSHKCGTMAGHVDDIDIELFIGEIKNYPGIWNVASENYHDRTQKRAAWVSVCRVFFENFDEKEDTEKNEICNKLIKKWRNIKDNYMKSLKKKKKSGQAADSGRRYIYSKQLSFLQTAGATVKTQNSLSDEEEQEDVDDPAEESSEQNPTDSEALEKPPRYNQNSRKRKRDIESTLIDFMKAPIPVPSVAAVSEPDPDRSFFESILPSIRQFTEDEKLEFRSEILNLIQRMRTSSSSQTHRYQVNTPYIPSTLSYPTYEMSRSSNFSPEPHSQQPPVQFSAPITESPNYSARIQFPHNSKQFTQPRTHPSNMSCPTYPMSRSSNYSPEAQSLQSPVHLTTPTTHSTNYLPRTQFPHASNRLTEIQTRPYCTAKAQFSGLNFKPGSPSLSSSPSVPSEEESLDLFRDGRSND